MYGRIINDVPEIGLPLCGVLLDGTTVSNYYLMKNDQLTAEGWLPVEEIRPTYDEATQELVRDTVTSDGKMITITYKAVEREISAEEALAALLEALG